jgi:hypothetical protein
LVLHRKIPDTFSVTPFPPHRHVLEHQWTYEDRRARRYRCDDILCRSILLSFACLSARGT